MKTTACLTILGCALLSPPSLQADAPLLDKPIVEQLVAPVDVAVSRNYDGNYMGDNVYTNTSTNQRITQYLKKRSAKTYFRVQNDAWENVRCSCIPGLDPSNAILWNIYDLRATKGGKNFDAKFIDLKSGDDITAQVTRGLRLNISTAYDRIIVQKTRSSRSKGRRSREFTLSAASVEPVPRTNTIFSDAASVLLIQKKEKAKRK